MCGVCVWCVCVSLVLYFQLFEDKFEFYSLRVKPFKKKRKKETEGTSLFKVGTFCEIKVRTASSRLDHVVHLMFM